MSTPQKVRVMGILVGDNAVHTHEKCVLHISLSLLLMWYSGQAVQNISRGDILWELGPGVPLVGLFLQVSPCLDLPAKMNQPSSDCEAI